MGSGGTHDPQELAALQNEANASLDQVQQAELNAYKDG
jgi:hypothetical protein